MRNRFAVAVLGLALAFGAQGLDAQTEWAHEVSLSLWASGADGSVAFESSDGPVDLEFDDLWRMEPGFAGTAQGQKGKWGYLLDVAYGRNAIGDYDWSLSFLSAGATYRLSEGRSTVNLAFGGRHISASGGLRVLDPDEADEDSDDDRFKKLSAAEGWVDLFVGLQLVRPIGQRMAFEGWVDVGAGQGNLSYQVAGGVSYRFSPTIAARAGYRLISADYDDDNTDQDMMFGGFYGGVGFSF